MNDPKDIITLFGIPADKIKGYESTLDSRTGNSTLFLELINVKEQCPYCHNTNIIIKGYYLKHLNNSSNAQKPILTFFKPI